MIIDNPTPLTAQEEGVVVTTRNKINFVGTSVTVTEDAVNDRILVTIAGGGGGDLLADGTVPLTANWDVGAFKLTAAQLESDIADGTAPLIVTSTTVVANLNASKLEGNAASAFTPIAHATATTGVHGVGAGTIAKTADITATKIDDLTAGDDNTDLNANTTNHGLLLKATAPAATLLNVVGIANGETAYTNKALFDATVATDSDVADAGSAGTSVVAARVDHAHKIDQAIADNAVLTVDDAGAADDEWARFTANGIEGVANQTALSALLASVLLENDSIQLDPALSADGKWNGVTESGTAGAALAFGDICYLAVADSRWELAKADAAATSFGKLGICILAAAGDASATNMLLYGKVRADAVFPAMTVGAPVFISAATAGGITSTAPSGTTNFVVRIIGHANTADELYFHPDNDYIELA